MVKLWIDDVREAPEGYRHIRTTAAAILRIETYLSLGEKIEVIDIDHDAGDYALFGGDYIKVLDWLAFKGYNIPIHIHSMNPVGVENMLRVCRRNNWTVI